MKRLITYPASLLILIAMQGIIFLGLSFKFDQYDVVAWISQITSIVLTLGLAELWARDWEDKY